MTIAHRGTQELDRLGEGLETYNPMLMLHGEEQVIFNKPFVVDKTYVCSEGVIDVKDKKKGCLCRTETSIVDKESGELYATVRTGLFLRKLGGFGFKGKTKDKILKPPQRAPDFVGEEVTQANQAFVYRLNCDLNPLHVDPQMAALGGFEKPILHGLCTYAISTRAVQKKYSPKDAQALEQVNARFTSFVLPGETLLVEMWKEGNIVIFQTKTKERGVPACQGFVTLKPQPKL